MQGFVTREDIELMQRKAHQYVENTNVYFIEPKYVIQDIAAGHYIPYATQVPHAHFAEYGKDGSDSPHATALKNIDSRYAEYNHWFAAEVFQIDDMRELTSGDTATSYMKLLSVWKEYFPKVSTPRKSLFKKSVKNQNHALLEPLSNQPYERWYHQYAVSIISLWMDLLSYEVWEDFIHHVNTIYTSVEEYYPLLEKDQIIPYLQIWLLANAQTISSQFDTTLPTSWNRSLLAEELVQAAESQQAWLHDFLVCIVQAHE